MRVRWNFERTIHQFAVHWGGAFLGVLLTGLLLDPYIRLPETGSLMYWATAAAFAAVLAALNVYVRPLMYLATLPLTCCFMVLTLGFGHFLVGAFMFWLAGQIIPPIDLRRELRLGAPGRAHHRGHLNQCVVARVPAGGGAGEWTSAARGGRRRRTAPVGLSGVAGVQARVGGAAARGA